MEYAGSYSLRRTQRKWRSSFLLHPGLLAVVAVLSLSLIVYCWPLKHHALSSSKGSSQNQNQRPQGKLGSPLLQSAEAAATFLGSKGGLDGSKLEVQGRKSDKISATSIKGKLGLPNQSLEDSVQQEGVDVSSEENRERAAFSINELREGECGNGVCRNGSVSEGDFVFAVATHQNNEPTLMAGRAGRLGMRTYVSTNYTLKSGQSYPSVPSEIWGYYPDDTSLRSYYEGDTRAALVPFLAFKDLGDTFKWVFYGDDDTIFFVDAAMELVKDLDPEMPYFLTDHFWYSNWNYGYPWHPHWRAPRCLPCHSTTNVSQLRMTMVKACPCTPEAMCALKGGYDKALDSRKCTTPRAPTLTYSMHGGAGALISIGMLKAVDFDEMEDCVLREWSTGGDSFITICLWKVGFGMTDPGVMWHPEGLTRFDPSPKKLIIDHTPYVIPRASYTVANLVAKAAGLCTGVCELETKHVLSLHLRGRLLTNSSNGAGALLRGVTRFQSSISGRLPEDSRQRGSLLKDVYDAKSEKLAMDVDELFNGAVETLKAVAPNFKGVAAAKKAFPAEGGASLFMPASAQREAAKNGAMVTLSEEALIKGGAAAIMQRVLQDVVDKALALYPPL